MTVPGFKVVDPMTRPDGPAVYVCPFNVITAKGVMVVEKGRVLLPTTTAELPTETC